MKDRENDNFRNNNEFRRDEDENYSAHENENRSSSNPEGAPGIFRGLGQELLGKWQETVENNSRELIQKVDQVGQDLTDVVSRQLSQKPWMYLGSAATLGILLGFLIAKPNFMGSLDVSKRKSRSRSNKDQDFAA